MTALWVGPLVAIIIIAILETQLYKFKYFYLVAGVILTLVIAGSAYLAFFAKPENASSGHRAAMEIPVPGKTDPAVSKEAAAPVAEFLDTWAKQLAETASKPKKAEALFGLYMPDVMHGSSAGDVAHPKMAMVLAGFSGMNVSIEQLKVSGITLPHPKATFELRLVKADAIVQLPASMSFEKTEDGFRIASETGVWDTLNQLDEMTQKPATIAAADTPQADPPSEETKTPVEPKEPRPETVLPASDHGPYTIQIGSYRKWPVALETARELMENGAVIYTTPVEISGKGVWFRMFYGRYASQTTAKKQAAELLKSGFDYAVVYKRPVVLVVSAPADEKGREEILDQLTEMGGIPFAEDGGWQIGAYRSPEEARLMVDRLTKANLTYRILQP